MIKTILVPVGGGDADEAVFETALTVARPLLAHLEFLHVHVRPGEAAHHTPHVDFARGAALRNALQDLGDKAATRAAEAARHVSEFCARWKIDMVDKPRAPSPRGGGKRRAMPCSICYCMRATMTW